MQVPELAPPQEPLQVQVQGPEPLIALAVPELQSPELGAEEYVAPLAGPQTPLIGADLGALQGALVPPPLPLQVQVQGPEPDTAVAVPTLQRLTVGMVQTLTPLAEPQAPLTTEAGQLIVMGLVPYCRAGLLPAGVLIA